MPTLLLVDGSSYLYRAFHALPDPRNQSGEPTKQTAYVEEFVKTIAELDIDAEIVYQDESLTSVQAEARLGTRIKNKGEIDAEAASIILQDYLEAQYAH